MKRKIILLLTVLLMAMFFTGCGARILSYETVGKELELADELAELIAKNGNSIMKIAESSENYKNFQIEEYDEKTGKLILKLDEFAEKKYIYIEYEIVDKTAKRVDENIVEYSKEERIQVYIAGIILLAIVGILVAVGFGGR